MSEGNYDADQPERAQAVLDLGTLTDHVHRINSDFGELNNRLDSNAAELASLRATVAALDRGQIKIIGQLDENTALTQKTGAGTAELIEFFTAVKGAFKVLEVIGRAAKPLAVIAGLITAVTGAWLAIKGSLGGK